MNPTPSSHRADLDWLRVLAISSVFFFHNARFFDLGGWHVKNATGSPFVQTLVSFMTTWMMPVIFLISAASLVFALSRGLTGKFFTDKVKRLLVPLLVGVFIFSPPQVYLERLTYHQTSLSFFAWLPQYFDGLYAFGGNFAFMGLHLWYVLALLIFTLIFLPVFLLLKTRAGRAFISALARAAEFPGVIVLFGLLILVPLLLVHPDSPLSREDMGGWPLFGYMPFFLLGFILFSDSRFQQAVIRHRWVALVSVVVLVAGYILLVKNDDFPYLSTGFILINLFRAMLAWMCIIAILGFGMRHLTFENRFLRYASEAVLPFYILHQPVILIVGYFIVRLDLPIAAKYVIIASLSFAIIMSIYEFAVRRANLLRFLFGIKPLRRVAAPTAAPVPDSKPAGAHLSRPKHLPAPVRAGVFDAPFWQKRG